MANKRGNINRSCHRALCWRKKTQGILGREKANELLLKENQGCKEDYNGQQKGMIRPVGKGGLQSKAEHKD